VARLKVPQRLFGRREGGEGAEGASTVRTMVGQSLRLD
jgi:hypothetical protein